LIKSFIVFLSLALAGPALALPDGHFGREVSGNYSPAALDNFLREWARLGDFRPMPRSTGLALTRIYYERDWRSRSGNYTTNTSYGRGRFGGNNWD
jgi:hypothetical protein